MDVLRSLAGGILAGFGVAAPLGAIGILLLREGLAAGFRAAAPGAFAVALVDAAYCALAVLAGAAAAPLVASWGALPAVAGGTALLVLGLAGIRRTWRGTQGPGPTGAPAPEPAKRRSRSRFMLFLALTAVNPVTLLYFAALAAGLQDLLAPPAGPAAFIAGVALSSLAWQLGLVFAGACLRDRASAAVQRSLSVAGHATVTLLGAAAVVFSLQ
ncbi:LysE family transporter [Arthrobacter sp. Sa2BUA2]|uniref:LysE family transporter n=1 Tax=Arthrobacter pullicola TaxID=2762224 RepID=A0ABR8YE04_9MICC|nr:LysE family transporter [Arthrobacter pullicola]MBD8042440.1 LysE family transporter [Arthrobacter pullicola]